MEYLLEFDNCRKWYHGGANHFLSIFLTVYECYIEIISYSSCYISILTCIYVKRFLFIYPLIYKNRENAIIKSDLLLSGLRDGRGNLKSLKDTCVD